MSDLYCVTYFLYCDTETLHTEVFETQEEASKFEDFIWDQCQEAHIEVDVTTTKTTIRSLEDAKKSLEEVLSKEEDDEE